MLSGAYGTGPLTVGMASFGQFISVPVCVFKTKQQLRTLSGWVKGTAGEEEP